MMEGEREEGRKEREEGLFPSLFLNYILLSLSQRLS